MRAESELVNKKMVLLMTVHGSQCIASGNLIRKVKCWTSVLFDDDDDDDAEFFLYN